MNICLLSKEYPPETHYGGIGTFTINMAEALNKLGHCVHVITSTKTYPKTSINGGVVIHQIKDLKIRPKVFDNLCYSYLVSQKISSIDCAFDIIHASEFRGEAFYYSLHKKAPLITRLATPLFLVMRNTTKGLRLQKHLMNLLEKMQAKRSDGIFSSTFALAKEVSDEWGIDLKRIHIIPNGIDVNKVIRLSRRESSISLNGKNGFLLYFGRLEERKGVHILVHSLPEVFKYFPTIRMVFIGKDEKYKNGSMQEYIKASISEYRDNLVFFGNLPQEKLFPIVAKARLVILPSLWEAFGFVSIEALALGIPVIATSGSGYDEIIKEGVNSYMVPPGNSSLLAEKIISCLNNKDTLLNISENAKRRAWDFDISTIAVRLIEYYKKVLNDQA